MKLLTIVTRTMNTRTMSSAALMLAAVLFAPAPGKTQQLQRGVSVKMAATSSAPSMPEADDADAWIVTVTGDNYLYFGLDPVTSAGLLEAMKSRPRNRGQELYVKADARASFSTVKRVFEVAHADLFDRAVLLTEQSSVARPGAMVPPKGLTVWISSVAAPEAVIVQIGPGQGSPLLKIDNQEVPLNALQHRLEQLMQGRRDRTVVLKAGQVPFADVAHVIDACNMSGAKAVLGTPEL
jgi:biopolymer transport protein ExbD